MEALGKTRAWVASVVIMRFKRRMPLGCMLMGTNVAEKLRQELRSVSTQACCIDAGQDIDRLQAEQISRL